MKKRWVVKSVTLLVALSFVLASVCMALTASEENVVKVSNLGVKYHIIAGLHMIQSLYFPIDYSALPQIDPAP